MKAECCLLDDGDDDNDKDDDAVKFSEQSNHKCLAMLFTSNRQLIV